MARSEKNWIVYVRKVTPKGNITTEAIFRGTELMSRRHFDIERKFGSVVRLGRIVRLPAFGQIIEVIDEAGDWTSKHDFCDTSGAFVEVKE